MKKLLIAVWTLAGLGSLAVAAKMHSSPWAPGARTLMLAHNAYPDEGKFGDRLDRAISAGTPFVVEEDLVWVDGRSLLIHNPKIAGPDSPTLESYFFPKIKPVIEKALKDGNKGNWPLITLYLDIKNDPPEHLETISKMLDKYDSWLTKAVKTNDLSKQSPLELKPMMVIVEDKVPDIKEDFFYGRVPAGGKIRVFGTAPKFDDNPDHMPRAQRAVRMANLLKIQPESLLTAHADNYRRWIGVDWNFIELAGSQGEWSAESEARMKKFVDYGHSLGYLVSLYHVNGFPKDQDQGWGGEYNFGSLDAARVRWAAAYKAHADFVATDQYEDLAHLLRGEH